MNEQEEKAFQLLSKQIESAELRRIGAENNMSKMSEFNYNKEPNIIEYQLDVSPILDRIYHLLSGHSMARLSNGKEVWIEPTDDRLKILTDYGVKQIMNLLSFYINPNTLLSNLTEEQIEVETHDFGEELGDLIFCRYEHFFSYPSPEELYKKYHEIMHKNNLDLTDEELYLKCAEWSNQELQLKFRHYPIIWLALSDTVHKTLLRALGGEERESLRKQMMIHQSVSEQQNQQQEKKKRGLFNW